LAAGSYTYQASIAADPNYNTATSPTEPLTVDKGTLTLATTIHDASHNVVGGATHVPLGSVVHDNAKISGAVAGFAPTGAISFTLNGNSVANKASAEAGFDATSVDSAPLAAGSYTYQASIAADPNYNTATSPTEPLTVDKAPTDVSTTVFDAATDAAWTGTEKPGAKAYDTATLTGKQGSIDPTGTVTYTFFSGDCATGTVVFTDQQTVGANESVPNSKTTDSLAAGDYAFQAVYSGDSNYSGKTGSCEPFSVGKAKPSIVTTQDPASGNVGDTYKDQATLSNGVAPTGTITFDLYDNPNCTGTALYEEKVSVTNGNGTYETANGTQLTAGTYYWVATYGGDSNNSSAPSGCGDEPVTVNPASIKIKKVADAASVNAGDQVGFTLTVYNTGAGDAYGVKLNDTLPTNAGLSWSVDSTGADWGSPCTIDNAGVLHCGGANGVTVPSGTTLVNSKFTVHIVSGTTSATAGDCPGSGVVDNTGHVTTSNDGSDQSEATECVNGASIKVVKTADAAQVNVGSPIGFTVTVYNAGAGDAHGVKLSDTLPMNAGLSWSIAAQGAGWAGSCVIDSGVLECGGANGVTVPANTTQAASTFTVHITSPTTGATGGDCPTTGVVDNTGNVTTSNDGSDQSSASVCVQAQVDLAITKVGSPENQDLGQGNITWTMVVTNNGPSADTGVKISDPMPAGNTYVSSTTTKGTCTGGAILTCDIGDMAAGETVTITLVTTPSTTGIQTNTATVSGDRPETNLGNNVANASVNITAPFVSPPCVLIKRITPGQLVVGRKTTVTMHLTQGNKAAPGFKVRIKGAGINVVTKASDARGIIKRTLKMKRKGILRFEPIRNNNGNSCGAVRVGVRGPFTPPVTG
jgi:uncharacterized repeat protein (TIGR01451 family)